MQPLSMIAIDSQRRAMSVTIAVLCRAAKVSESTYARRLRSPDAGNMRTLRRLAEALQGVKQAKVAMSNGEVQPLQEGVR